MGRNVVDVGIPPFADLLAATDLVQCNDSVCRLRLEVRRRIVERDVPVFADADTGKVDKETLETLQELEMFAKIVTAGGF